ncbi:hypothetical protein KM043_012494 [Ampulex compressa]|nr:hypothetical protein KM043_012494 [Ampulex compressa]
MVTRPNNGSSMGSASLRLPRCVGFLVAMRLFKRLLVIATGFDVRNQILRSGIPILIVTVRDTACDRGGYHELRAGPGIIDGVTPWDPRVIGVGGRAIDRIHELVAQSSSNWKLPPVGLRKDHDRRAARAAQVGLLGKQGSPRGNRRDSMKWTCKGGEFCQRSLLEGRPRGRSRGLVTGLDWKQGGTYERFLPGSGQLGSCVVGLRATANNREPILAREIQGAIASPPAVERTTADHPRLPSACSLYLPSSGAKRLFLVNKTNLAKGLSSVDHMRMAVLRTGRTELLGEMNLLRRFMRGISIVCRWLISQKGPRRAPAIGGEADRRCMARQLRDEKREENKRSDGPRGAALVASQRGAFSAMREKKRRERRRNALHGTCYD